MSFYQQLKSATAPDREALVQTDMIARCLRGDVTVPDYVNFLQQAFHHVKHTVPLMMAAGSRLTEDKEWLREAVAEYIEEELGHQEWVLNDIAACGYDKELARASAPNVETELLVAYAYDLVNRVNPVGFFGMVLVLEGTSVALADNAASVLKNALGLPEQAFSYLRSHGSLDQDHIQFLEKLLNRFEDPDDRALITHSARVFYRLYRGVFEGVARQSDSQEVLHAAAG